MFCVTTHIFLLNSKRNKAIKYICILSALLAYFCLAYLNIYAQQEEDKEEEAVFVAQKAFDDGFYDVSLSLLERFVKNYPNSTRLIDANLLVGRCYFQQNKFIDALNKFEEIISEPRAEKIKDAALFWAAEVHFKGNNFEKAASYYKEIIDKFQKSPYLSAAYYSLGWCYFQTGKFKDAMDYFSIIEDKYPKDSHAEDASFKILECLYNLKEYSLVKKKIDSHIKAYAKDKTRLSYLYFYLGESEYYLNNFNNAIEAYSKAISNTSDNKLRLTSQLGQAWSCIKTKDYKAAEGIIESLNANDLDKKNRETLLLAKAVLLTETNRITDAVSVYDKLIPEASDQLILAQAYLGKADGLYNLANYQEAEKTYKEGLDKIASQNDVSYIIDKLHYGLSWSYLKLGEFRNAIKEFQKIVKTSDDKIVKVSALCQIGDAYQDSGDYLKAQETYDTIIKDYPGSFYSDYVQYQLGITLLKSGKYDGAVTSFLVLRKNYPESKLLDETVYALGLAYFQKQDYLSSAEALDEFRKSFKDSNLRAQAMYLLGTNNYNMGRFKEAIEVFKDVVRNFSNDRELVQKAEYEIADCLYQMGDEKEALARFKILRSKYPDTNLTAEIMWWLGVYYHRHNDLKLSRRYFSSLIQDFPNSNLVIDAYYALGTSYTVESRDDEAIQYFRKVMNSSKSDLSAQSAIAVADIYAKKGQTELAFETYDQTLKKFPNLINLIYPKIAELFFKTAQFDKALEYYRKSLEVVPVKEMAAIQFKIAETLEAKGMLDNAIEEYSKVSYLYSDTESLAVKALLRMATILENKENFKEASNIYKKIISMNTEETKYAKERLDIIEAK